MDTYMVTEDGDWIADFKYEHDAKLFTEAYQLERTK